jgi:hypothetical protein
MSLNLNIDLRLKIPLPSKQSTILNNRPMVKRPISPSRMLLSHEMANSEQFLVASKNKKTKIDTPSSFNFTGTPNIKQIPYKNTSQRTIILVYDIDLDFGSVF